MRPLVLLAGALLAVPLASCSGGQEGAPPTATTALPSASGTASGTSGTTPPRSGSTGTTPASPPGTSSAGTTSATPTTSGRPATSPIVVAHDLSVPWGLAFLPDGEALVTLRDQAKVLLVVPGSAPVSLGTVPGVRPEGEGGLLGIAVSPRFADDHTVFVYLTAADDNRVLRMSLEDNQIRPDKVILDGIPKASNHNGGRLAFGPDGFLYVSTGDAGQSENAQNRGSLGGKILRIDRNGKAAPGNPFPGSPVWTLGHRNVQGMAWDSEGRMYASEFGQNTWDELNRIKPGQNYGWPVVEGRAGRPGFVDPLVQWSTDEASPSGIAIGDDGAVYMAALQGQCLWRIPLDQNGDAGKPERLLQGDYGRLRAVAGRPDGRLWLLTSNTFRGDPRPGDDKVVILPAGFPASG